MEVCVYQANSEKNIFSLEALGNVPSNMVIGEYQRKTGKIPDIIEICAIILSPELDSIYHWHPLVGFWLREINFRFDGCNGRRGRCIGQCRG